MAKRWTQEQKDEIIEYANQHSKAAAKRKYGVSVEAINYWTKEEHRTIIKNKQRADYEKNHLNSKYTCAEMREIAAVGLDKACESYNIDKREYERISQYITRIDNYNKQHRERIYKKTKEWYEKNSDKNKQYNKIYNEVNKDKIRQRVRQRKKIDHTFKLKENLRTRIWQALKHNRKSYSVTRLIGCTIDEFKKHIECQFKDEMLWDNYGTLWHIDHIKPLSLFDLSDPQQQLIAFHYTNCQPLLAYENLKKSNKYTNEI
jgi:hypothetical protein